MRLSNIATHEAVKALRGHKDRVSSVVFSADGNNVVSGSYDCLIRIWDTHLGKAVGEPLRGHLSGVQSVAISPDGQWPAAGSYKETVRIRSTSTLSLVHVLKGYSS